MVRGLFSVPTSITSKRYATATGKRGYEIPEGYRFCYIRDDQRDQLDFDIRTEGRYHHQVVEMRKVLDSLQTINARNKFCTKWGMSLEPPCLSSISPALDLILSRPGDPAHSEYNGVSKLMHTLILETILTKRAAELYAVQLRKFPFPPGWPRVQNPVKHLKSYSLSEYARWSLVIPILLHLSLTSTQTQSHRREDYLVC